VLLLLVIKLASFGRMFILQMAEVCLLKTFWCPNSYVRYVIYGHTRGGWVCECVRVCIYGDVFDVKLLGCCCFFFCNLVWLVTRFIHTFRVTKPRYVGTTIWFKWPNNYLEGGWCLWWSSTSALCLFLR